MISVKNLSYKIEGNAILDALDLSVRPQEYYALAGENGSGKSTLIKIILDLIRTVVSGSVLIDGAPRVDVNTRRQLAYLPEKFDVKKEASGWQYLRFVSGIYQRELNRSQVLHLCASLDLDESSLDLPSAKYSKGMKQKLGLISCFMLDTPLIILDEPLSGLDPRARFLFKQLLQQERNKNRTIFYSTHMLADAEEICDRFGILHQGRIVFDGTPAECINRYQVDTLEQAYMRCITETEADRFTD